MDRYEVTVKAIEPVRVAATSSEVTELSQIGELLGQLYPKLYATLGRHGITPREPSYAIYEHRDDRSGTSRITAALPVPDDTAVDDDGVTTIDLAPAARAATTVVRGSPDAFHEAFQALHDWVRDAGDQPAGVDREVYLHSSGPRDTWITELQVILEAEPSHRR
jgi:effector-binding domain-containing protein